MEPKTKYHIPINDQKSMTYPDQPAQPATQVNPTGTAPGLATAEVITTIPSSLMTAGRGGGIQPGAIGNMPSEAIRVEKSDTEYGIGGGMG